MQLITKKIISYIFTIPASTLFYIAEVVRGEKITWRYKEAINSTKFKCKKCGHSGKPEIIN